MRFCAFDKQYLRKSENMQKKKICKNLIKFDIFCILGILPFINFCAELRTKSEKKKVLKSAKK
jgi:chloramphenicol O-acetyltransferase